MILRLNDDKEFARIVSNVNHIEINDGVIAVDTETNNYTLDGDGVESIEILDNKDL